jgi:hypothetical protein
MLVQRSGVRCDLTGIILSGDFVYYSVTGRKIHVMEKVVTSDKEVGIDLDLCESAFQSLIEKCRPFIGHTVFDGATMKCELSGKTLSGQYDYWHLVFDKISVPSSKADPKTGDVPIEVINGVLDLNICHEEGEKLLETKGTWRKTPMPS